MRFGLCALVFLPVLASAATEDQFVLSPTQGMTDAFAKEPTLFDLLTIQPAASIFFSYARETRISQLFQERDARSTLLVPTNKAIKALARKP